MQIYKVIAFVVVFLQVKGSPLNNNSKHTGGTERKTSDSFQILQHWKSYHLFPHWVSEIGEIALIVLDYVWHNELTEEIQQVNDQVREINSKLDALLVLATSPAPPQLFFQLKKSSPVADVSAVENGNLKMANIPNGKTELKWKKITKEDGNKIHHNN